MGPQPDPEAVNSGFYVDWGTPDTETPREPVAVTGEPDATTPDEEWDTEPAWGRSRRSPSPTAA